MKISQAVRTARVVMLLAVVALAAGCAGIERKPLAPEVGASIKSVGIVTGQPPIERLGIWGPPRGGAGGAGAVAGAALTVLLGPIGGAIAGGMEASITQGRLDALNAAMKDRIPPLIAIFESELERLLTERGLKVTKVPMPPKSPDGKGFQWARIDTDADAILAAGFSFAGLANDASNPSPVLLSFVRMMRPRSEDTFMLERIAYGTKPVVGDWTATIDADPKFKVDSLEEVAKQPDLVSEGLVDAVRTLAQRFAELVRPNTAQQADRQASKDK